MYYLLRAKSVFFRYAFVVHRTSQEAKHNLQQYTDSHILGPECRIEYARNCLAVSNDQEDFERTKVMVSQIPNNVCENELHHLFVNCRVIKYCPARTVHVATTTAKTEHNSKILWG